jgi:hypothetical protein
LNGLYQARGRPWVGLDDQTTYQVSRVTVADVAAGR